jgi:predicted metal-binding protein
VELQYALKIARESGFDVMAPMDPQKLKFLPAVRDMCAANTRGQYGKKWICPPTCGDISEMAGRYHRFSNGVIFQTICRLDDEYDLESMYGVMENYVCAVRKLIETLGELGEEIVPFGSDGCGHCVKCAYQNAPCRFPKRAFPSLEACGLLVSDVCKDNDVPYYYYSVTAKLCQEKRRRFTALRQKRPMFGKLFGITEHYGRNTVAYTGAFLFNPEAYEPP